jgi:hypothetical protein
MGFEPWSPQATTNGPLFLALINVKKERPGGFEPWSARWGGGELPLSYNMIAVQLVYVIPLIDILMEHHPHLNLGRGELPLSYNMISVPLVYVIPLIGTPPTFKFAKQKKVHTWDLNPGLLSGKRETYH